MAPLHFLITYENAMLIKTFLVATALTAGCGIAACQLQAVEYLPGIEWPEPKVITPGKSSSEPPSDATILFDGTDLTAWYNGDRWTVSDGVATIGKGSLTTKGKFGDCQLHIEWSIPKSTKGKGQKRGNSGITFMVRDDQEIDLYTKYEVQILDSYENETYYDGQAAAIYKQSPPMVNATRPPGEWNNYDIIFTAPRFAESGKLLSPAFITMLHNGVLVHNHFELQGTTSWIRPPLYLKHDDKLPIGLQHHKNKVHFRNIWVRDIEPIVGRRVSEPMYRDKGKTWPVSEAGGDGNPIKK